MNKNKNNTKILRYIIIIVAVIVLILLVVGGVGVLNKDKITTNEGIEYLKEAEKGDVASIEHKIEMLDEKDRALTEAEAGGKNYKAVFSNSVIMGDSISLGFTAYDHLTTSSVVAKSGVAISDISEQMEIVKEMQPKVIFLSYGSNDVEKYGENVSAFIKDYKKVIKTLSEDLPNAKIFVNSIFPVRKDAVERQPLYAYIEEYNVRLQKMCDEMQIAFLDNTSLARTEYFEQDGVHFISSFYPVWLEHMQTEASL